MFKVRFHSKSFLLCWSSFTSKITFTSKVLLVKLKSEIKQPTPIGQEEFHGGRPPQQAQWPLGGQVVEGGEAGVQDQEPGEEDGIRGRRVRWTEGES